MEIPGGSDHHITAPGEGLERGITWYPAVVSTYKDRVPAIDRFMRKVEKTDTCWLWTGGRFDNGYGVFRDDEQRLGRAHRFAYKHFNGPVPDGLLVRHTCDVRHCVNPEHLIVGTQLANQDDCRQRERWGKRRDQAKLNGTGGQNALRGARHPRSSLTALQATQLIAQYENDNITKKSLAERYGVSTATVHKILSNRERY